MTAKSLQNKLAVITGGTRGIGCAIADRLKNNGLEVIVTGTTHKNIPKNFGFYAVDFTNENAAQDFSDVLKKIQPDILINNAGINVNNDFNDIVMEDFSRIQQINVIAPFQLCRSVVPAMKEKQWGRIINISSIWGHISKQGRAAYSASKFALDGMTAALAAEVAQYGILANCVAPGFIETDLTRKTLGEEGMKAMAQQIPMRRLGKPEEIAALVAWLVSEENTYISGQQIIIDGGFVRV